MRPADTEVAGWRDPHPDPQRPRRPARDRGHRARLLARTRRYQRALKRGLDRGRTTA